MEKKTGKKVVIAIAAALAVAAAGVTAFTAVNKNRNNALSDEPTCCNIPFDITVEGDRIVGGFGDKDFKAVTVREMTDMGWKTEVDINEIQKVEADAEATEAGIGDYEVRWYDFTKNESTVQLQVTAVDGETLSDKEVTELQVADGKTAEVEIAGQKMVLGQTEVKELLNSGWENTVPEFTDLNTLKYDETVLNPVHLAYGDSETVFVVSGNNGDIFTDCVITGVMS